MAQIYVQKGHVSVVRPFKTGCNLRLTDGSIVLGRERVDVIVGCLQSSHTDWIRVTEVADGRDFDPPQSDTPPKESLICGCHRMSTDEVGVPARTPPPCNARD